MLIAVSWTWLLGGLSLIILALFLALILFGAVYKWLVFPWEVRIDHRSDSVVEGPSAHDYWQAAIECLVEPKGKLLREWVSHIESGERLNRIYCVENTKVYLELDRWKGFRIYGKPNAGKLIWAAVEKYVKPKPQ